jgi:hypothetical protein
MCDAAKSRRALPTEKELADHDAFDALYSQWLAMRAAFVAGIEDDEEWSRRADEFEALETKMLFTPIPVPWMLWRKWEVLELALNAERLGMLAEPERSFRALAAIKSDLTRLGFGD